MSSSLSYPLDSDKKNPYLEHVAGDNSSSTSFHENEHYRDDSYDSTAHLGEPSKIQNRSTYTEEDLDKHSMQIAEDSPATPLVRKLRNGQPFDDLDPYNNDATATKDLSRSTPAQASLNRRIENKKRGIGRQRHPFVVYILTAAMIGVFIYELILNSRQQGSPLSFKPVVNPMLGPSSSALINLGARFPPCMKLVDQIPPSTLLGCMNNTANPPTSICTVEDLCGFGGFHNKAPNQWFRFITAIFLHAGIVHILLNMLAQLIISAQVEREMGSAGFLLTYFAAGIFGNVLGGNFSLVGVPSIGASGAIFGTAAVAWVDLIAHWKYQYQPVKRLIFMTIELIIGIAIGYIPFVDNFAHIGGFVMGLLVGTVLYPVISVTRRHRLIMWAFRLAAVPVAVVLFFLLIRNFYTSNPYAACSGCRYLSCIPTKLNNHCQGTGLTSSNGSI
ncbi:rhomboid-domain-containing protein [Phlegmacium glaucopus]|nr:rhomboid-domain-containing protein [Phlegmacium glaucopus]